MPKRSLISKLKEIWSGYHSKKAVPGNTIAQGDSAKAPQHDLPPYHQTGRPTSKYWQASRLVYDVAAQYLKLPL
jgi:hypothetical protein